MRTEQMPQNAGRRRTYDSPLGALPKSVDCRINSRKSVPIQMFGFGAATSLQTPTDQQSSQFNGYSEPSPWHRPASGPGAATPRPRREAGVVTMGRPTATPALPFLPSVLPLNFRRHSYRLQWYKYLQTLLLAVILSTALKAIAL
jgi:hypothetical protein